MGFMDVIIHPPSNEKDIFESIASKSACKINNRNGLNISGFIDLVNQGHLQDIPIHEILEKCELEFSLPIPPPRNPELEERITKLKAEQANAEYKSMTKNLCPSPRTNISIGDDVRSMNSQITAVINFVFAVAGSFFFAYKAVEYALPEPNIPAQVMIGIVTSTAVAIADLYFLLRTI